MSKTKPFIAPEIRGFFAKHKFFECEQALDAQDCGALKEKAEALLQHRTDLDPFRAGRNLWHDSEEAKKALLPTQLLQIALNFYEQDALRIGLTHYFKPGPSPFSLSSVTLKTFTSLREVAGGVFLALDDASPTPLLPHTPGNAVFLDPDLPFPLAPIFAHPSLYLILFTSPNTLYCHQKEDPLTHDLKQKDYVFGDRMRNETNPLILRKT